MPCCFYGRDTGIRRLARLYYEYQMDVIKKEDFMGKIHSMESFGTVDGPGVRFVVFFEGCPMRCLYCHNPDTWHLEDGQEMSAEEILSRMERNRPFYRTGGITATGGEPMLQMDFLTELVCWGKGTRDSYLSGYLGHYVSGARRYIGGAGALKEGGTAAFGDGSCDA